MAEAARTGRRVRRIGAGPAPEVREAIAGAPEKPGIYRMYGGDGKLLYVGKAKQLANRMKSYLDPARSGIKTQRLIEQVVKIDFTVTASEVDALLLESNIIKHDRPRYNIVLRDDKSYPYIRVEDTLGFPRLAFYRGRREAAGRLYGPYPDAGAVRQTLGDLQKLFRLRNCRDGFFKNRTRPCIQHEIGRCSAPCVGRISEADYRRDFEDALRVLEGRGKALTDHLYARMNELAQALEFERAAALRDLLARLQQSQEREAMVAEEAGDADLWAIDQRADRFVVGLTRVREGRYLGTWSWFPSGDAQMDAPSVLSAFIAQYYDPEIPERVLVDQTFPDLDLLAEALGKQAGHPVRLAEPRGQMEGLWLEMTRENIRLALERELASHALLRERFKALRRRLELPDPVERIVCFDVSHTQGAETVASAVVFGAEGPVKPAYRRFNLRLTPSGDDYAGLAEALQRYFSRLLRESGPVPDLVLIDGGVGQLRVAERELQELGFLDLTLLAIAKGPERKVGLERIFLEGGRRELRWDPYDPAFHLLQQIRDEAHRFAITGHRRRHAAAQLQSFLEEIPGLGPKRRGILLAALGGLEGLMAASEHDLARIPGISRALAHRIHQHLHRLSDHETA